MLVDIQNSGAVWVDTGLDLTSEVIKRLDASKSTAPPKK
jgi:Skp family chaperone for outer membrane proteins